MKNSFIIVDIHEFYDPFWGKTVLVIANSLENISNLIGVNPYVNENSQYFQFPDGNLITRIENIANSKNIWTPSDDFEINRKPIGINNKDVDVNEHVSLYGITVYDKTENGGCTAVISNYETKKTKIIEEYNNSDSEYLPSDFIQSMDGDFYSWLFGCDYLKGASPQEMILFHNRWQAILELGHDLNETLGYNW